MKEPEKRIIYSNYNLWKDYENDAKMDLEDEGYTEDEITEEKIWDKIYELDKENWEIEKERLVEFFDDGSSWILRGTIGLWYGNVEAGTVFTDFEKMFKTAMDDCDYCEFYDENGHLYLRCAHHDGTNLYEIKRVTEKGIQYLKNWEENLDDKRTEQYVHDMIMKKYSIIPNFCHKIYGSSKIEWKKAA